MHRVSLFPTIHCALHKCPTTMLLILMIAYYLNLCFGFDVEKICMAKQNLEYKVIHYQCSFAGNGVYRYNGPEIESITFDRFTMDSAIFVENVNRVVFKKGTLELCKCVISRDNVKTVVGNHICTLHVSPALESTSVTATSTTTTTVFPITTDMDKEESGTLGHVGGWIAGFATSLVDVVQLCVVAILTILGILLRFYDQLNGIYERRRGNESQPLQQGNLPQPAVALQRRPQRLRRAPNRYGNWQS